MNDTYSKVMLTIIAAALCVNALQNINIVNPAHAFGHKEVGPVHKIAICDEDGMKCAEIGSFNSLKINNNGK